MRILLLLAMAVGASLIGSNCGGSGVGDPCVPEDEYLTTFSGFAVGEVNVESRSFQCLTRVCLVNHFQGRVSCPFGQTEDGYDDENFLAANPTCGPIKNSGRSKCSALNVAPSSMDPPDFQCANLDPGDDNCTDAGSLCADASCAPGGAEHARSCRVPDRDGSELEDRIQVPVDPQYVDRKAEDTVYCSCRCAGPDPSARYCACPSGFTCEPLVDDLGLGEKGQLAGSYCIRDGTRYEASSPPTTACRAGECGENVQKVENGAAVPVARNNGTTCEASGTICNEDIYCCEPAVANSNTNPANGPVAANQPWVVGRARCSEVGVTANLTEGSVRVCP
jgi:hypothetical protein